METKYVKCKAIGELGYPMHFNLEHKFEILEAMGKAILKAIPKACHSINLICRGTSGVIVATQIFHYMHSRTDDDVNIVYVSKGENRHGGDIEPRWRLRNQGVCNIIVDDFVSTGATMDRIYEQLVKEDVHIVDMICVSGCFKKSRVQFPVKKIIAQSFID